MPQNHLTSLTGIRFLAALAVVLFHYWEADATQWPRALVDLVRSGYVGVSFFFLLSGFILAYNYLDRIAAGYCDYREFLVARFARIFPMYMLGLLLSAPLVMGLVAAAWPGARVAALTAPVLLQAWAPNSATTWNGPGWSLSAEAFFYAVFPFAALWVLRVPCSSLGWVMLVTWLVSMLAPTAYILVDPDGVGAGNLNAGSTAIRLVKFNPLLRLPEFVAGVVLGRWFMLHQRAGTRPGGIGLISVAAAAGILVILSFSSKLPYILLHNGALLPLMSLLVFMLAWDEGPVARILSTRVFVLLGESSYALYILHEPLKGWADRAAISFGLRDHGGVMPSTAILAILASVIVLRAFEEPSRRWVRHHASRWILAGRGKVPAATTFSAVSQRTS